MKLELHDAYQSWHCGADSCGGFELAEMDSGSHLTCESCGRIYRSDGKLVSPQEYRDLIGEDAPDAPGTL